MPRGTTRVPDDIRCEMRRLETELFLARQTILDHYDLKKILPLQMDLVRDLAAGKVPPPAAQKIAAFNPATPCQHVMWKP